MDPHYSHKPHFSTHTPADDGSDALRSSLPRAEACSPGSGQGSNTNPRGRSACVVIIDDPAVTESPDPVALAAAFYEASLSLARLGKPGEPIMGGSYKSVTDAAKWFGVHRARLQRELKSIWELGGDRIFTHHPFMQVAGGAERPRFSVWIPDGPRSDDRYTHMRLVGVATDFKEGSTSVTYR